MDEENKGYVQQLLIWLEYLYIKTLINRFHSQLHAVQEQTGKLLVLYKIFPKAFLYFGILYKCKLIMQQTATIKALVNHRSIDFP